MKKTKIFFLTLLAGLLMGVNAWAADGDSNLGFFNFTDVASATQTSSVNENVKVTVVPVSGTLQTGTSTYSLEEAKLSSLNSNVGLTGVFTNAVAQTWIGSQKGAGIHLNITISGLTPENAYNISLVSGLDWEQAGNWNSIVTKNTYGSSDPELGADKKNMSPFKLTPFVITGVIANEDGEIVLQVYSSNGSHSCVINCLSIYGTADSEGTLKTGIYRIKNEYNGRGELVYNENYANPQLNNITLGSYNVNNVAPTGNGTYWYVRNFNKKLYIYNVEAGKFLQNSSDAVVFSANVNDQCTFTSDYQVENEVGYFRIISPTDANKFLSTSCGWIPGPHQVTFQSHEAAADYLSFIEDEGEDMEKYAEEVAAANNLIEGLVDVTYNIVFAGDTIKTQTFSVSIGNARPEITVPYACEADYSAVPATITEAGEYNVVVTATESFPFAFSADYDNAAWYTIKMRSGYAGCDGTYFPETNLSAQPSEAKYLFAFQGNPFAFKVLLPNEKYMINGGANNEKSTFGDEGTGFGIIACNDQVTFTIDGVTGTINDVQKSIGFWAHKNAYTDGGSKMDIQPVADINVYNIVFAEDAPAAGGVTYSEVTYNVSSAFNAVSSTTELTATDFTAVEVAGYEAEVTLSGRVVTVTYTATKSEAWLALSNLIIEAENTTMPEGPWGTDPGFYDEDAVEAFPGVLAAAKLVRDTETTDDVYQEATTTLQTALNQTKPIMPTVGKTYQLISAFPTFETTHGYKVAIYNNGGTNMRWMKLNDNSLSFYWTATAVDGNNVTFQSLSDDKYPSTFNTNDQPIPMTETETACILANLGEAQFNITSTGSKAPFHAGNHGGGTSTNGNVMIWSSGLNSCSSWYIHEVAFDYKTAVESYQGVEKMNASTDPEVTVTYPDELKPFTPAEVDAAIDNMDAINTGEATDDQMKAALRTNAPAIDKYHSIVAAYGALVTVDFEFAAEYGTLLMPCNSGKPEGMTIYTCAGITGTTLNLTEASSFSNQKPYIVQGTEGSKYQFIGYDKTPEDKSTVVTVGLLNGVYEDTTAPVGSYVLQNNSGVLGFYQVAAEAEPTVGALRCYLTLPEPEAKALFFDEATAIESIHNAEFIIHNDGKFLENGKIVIVKNNAKYNVAGQIIK